MTTWLVYFQGGPGFGPRVRSRRAARRGSSVLELPRPARRRRTGARRHRRSRACRRRDRRLPEAAWRGRDRARRAEPARAGSSGGAFWDRLRRLLRHALLVGFSGRRLAEAFLTGGLPPLGGSPGRHLPGDVPPGARPEPLVLRALSRRSRARPQRRRPPRCGGSEAPVGRPSDVMPLSRARNMLGMSDGRAAALHRRAPRRLACLRPRRRGHGHARLRAQSDLRRAPRGVLRAGLRDEWSAERTLLHDFPRGSHAFTGEHLSVDVRGLRALRPLRDAAHLLAEHVWPELYDVRRLRKTTCRRPRPSMRTTSTSSARIPRRRPRRFAGSARGSRSEYEHDGLRADGSRVLGRLIDLVRGDV